VNFGGSYNYYDGEHFGNLIWAQYASNSQPDTRWYENTGIKKQFDLFGKVNYQLTKPLSLFVDLQVRNIDYKIEGIHDNLQEITQQHQFTFFNPKTGIFYDINQTQQAYFSFAIAHREPTRNDYRDADPDHLPKPEMLQDYELGYSFTSHRLLFRANLFFMNYKDQLVLTGEINNVGSPIFSNIPQSYRAGIELSGGWKITQQLNWEANVSFSKNKALDFTEFVDNWSEPYMQIQNNLGDTDLSFSPEGIANSSFFYVPVKSLSIRFNSKYVGKQFIDNTSNSARSLGAWFVNDLLINYNISTSLIPEIGFHLSVSNLFSEKYESNAWIYRYYYEGAEYKEDGYFPQAPINFLAGISLRF
jgi:iron complex outermembrane receptor protein